MIVHYICDRKKCERCSSECLHTSDYEHALHKNYIPNINELFEPSFALKGIINESHITIIEKIGEKNDTKRQRSRNSD